MQDTQLQHYQEEFQKAKDQYIQAIKSVIEKRIITQCTEAKNALLTIREFKGLIQGDKELSIQKFDYVMEAMQLLYPFIKTGLRINHLDQNNQTN